MESKLTRWLILASGCVLGAVGVSVLSPFQGGPASTVEAGEPQVPASGLRLPSQPGPASPVPEKLRESDSPREVGEAASLPTQRSEVDPSSGLLESFLQAYRRGDVPDSDVAALLWQSLVAQGRLDLSLEVIERHLPHEESAFLALAVAYAEQGRTDRGRELLARCLAMKPEADWMLEEYAGQDPAGALPLYRARLEQTLPPADRDLRTMIAQLALKAGQLAEARAEVSELLARDPRNPDALRLLAQIDPAAAELAVRELAAAGGSDNDWGRFLYELTLEQGRVEEAVRQLESRLSRGLEVDTEDWGEVARAFHARGESEKAVEYWSRALDAEEGDPDSWTAALQEAAPQLLLSKLEAKSLQGMNDEFWGALGDARWRAGRGAAAADAWREAARLDPEDGEWTEKLAAVAAGRNPI
ncbi:MAG: tetratricopeptide repeat protein [Planctomycetes bacterium]|nr:tetratricopeptide repeat protein [Planctomycetota bacterium]